MLSGVKLYVALGIGAFILVLMGSVAFLWQVHKADSAKLDLAKQEVKTLSNDLSDATKEADAERQRAQELDATLSEQRQRSDALQISNSKLAGQLDALKKALPQTDQDCLNRSVPPAIREWLRGSNGADKNNPGKGAGKPHG